MIDAKQEILNTLERITDQKGILGKVNQEHIVDIVDYLDATQFKPNEKKTKQFIEAKIREISAELVRTETRSGD